MKLSKNTIKKWSTWANFILMTFGAVTIYLPDIVPSDYLPYVMVIWSFVIGACQFIKQGNLEKLNDV